MRFAWLASALLACGTGPGSSVGPPDAVALDCSDHTTLCGIKPNCQVHVDHCTGNKCIEGPGTQFSCFPLAMPIEDAGPACAELDRTACGHRHDCAQNTTFDSNTSVFTWMCQVYTNG